LKLFNIGLLQCLLLCCAATASALPGKDSAPPPALQARIRMTDTVPELQAAFSPGNQFDLVKAKAQFCHQGIENDWYQVPEYLTHWCIRNSEDYGDGKLGAQDDEAMHKRPVANDSILVRYKDATGQCWRLFQPSEYIARDFGDTIHHSFISEDKIKSTSPTESRLTYHSVEIAVNKATNKIVAASQQMRDTVYTWTEIDRMHLISKIHVRAFDFHGKMTDDEHWTIDTIDGGPGLHELPHTAKLPDGRVLWEMFAEYLKSHGMADKVPG